MGLEGTQRSAFPRHGWRMHTFFLVSLNPMAGLFGVICTILTLFPSRGKSVGSSHFHHALCIQAKNMASILNSLSFWPCLLPSLKKYDPTSNFLHASFYLSICLPGNWPIIIDNIIGHIEWTLGWNFKLD